ncbi:MAG: MOSC domain-containing protein [Phaeodactylibacter sp.]|nr:MOSC domain-containing protein [Phaeodactylibacter sp.]MCB9301205.1 MOSC domain-containing protein [Lewinellaceae bacterium]HQU57769.1 MOSC domain-containing protein [Saprospiraceae bacterium]
MQITALYTYPIKGLAGVYLPKARVEARGLAYDRRWMLTDRDGLFLSQRELPKLSLLVPDLTVSGLIIRHRFEPIEPLHIPLHVPEPPNRLQVQVWDDRCEALPVSREADEWFSEILHTHCRLVYMPNDVARPLNPDYGLPGEIVGFADCCPLLVIGEASLNDLNSRFEQPFPMDRFRPNIVFAGGQPYEEDHWKDFQIGNVPFRGIRRCGRCQVITIDQQLGEVGKEPLRTLSTYRREGHKIFFGLHAAWAPDKSTEALPHIQVGDEVIISKPVRQ